MDIDTIAKKIRDARAEAGLTQKQLAERLHVTDSAISKWECGSCLPDLAQLQPLCYVLHLDLSSFLVAPREAAGSCQLLALKDDKNQLSDSDRYEDETAPLDIVIDTKNPAPLSPFIFSHNLEHTRATLYSGLSAQMLKNRKFAGMPMKNCGAAADWFPIGEKVLFVNDAEPYTRHTCLLKMRRINEMRAQQIQNLIAGQTAGIGQGGIALERKRYDFRLVYHTNRPAVLTLSLTDRTGGTVYISHTVPLVSTEWETVSFSLDCPREDLDGAVRYTFTERASVTFGALSMLPADHFFGMRRDVVACLKEIGPASLRWPGGNFAGEYRWMDGLLPADMRGPLQAVTEIETQPYSHGFDFHEIGTDEFIALCREVGAEPYLTINLAWNTPEESAKWVEYCNGSVDTEYGKIRAERGHPEPYRVRFWSLGNEMGYAHMEGPHSAAEYAEYAEAHAKAMKKVSPDLVFCSSGPYPNATWAKDSAAKLADTVPYISQHYYSYEHEFSYATFDYTSDDAIGKTYRIVQKQVDVIDKQARKMRDCLDATGQGQKLHISFDEWNYWFAWYRPSCVTEGIFCAKMLHLFLRLSKPLDIPFVCYFQPVGEGAILITPTQSRLTANGQIFSLMKVHKGGALCTLSGTPADAVATVKDGICSFTVVNDCYAASRTVSFDCVGEIQSAKLLSSDDVTPHSFFEEEDLSVSVKGNKAEAVLPPHSVACIRMRLPGKR